MEKMKICMSQFLCKAGYNILLLMIRDKFARRNIYKVIDYLEHHYKFISFPFFL